MKVRLFLFLILFGQITLAQSDLDLAKERLQNLKEGMLLVRLQTSSKQIQALEERGMLQEAEAYRQKQYDENKETILAFRKVFDFCPVFFFYADDSEAIRSKALEGTIFDSQLEVLTNTRDLPDFFLTGEFAETPNLKIDGFVIMDEQMLPLKSPFPFYQREHILLGIITLSKGKMIENLNTRLWDTYRLWFEEQSWNFNFLLGISNNKALDGLLYLHL